jgi:hypothetical protein
MSILMQMLKLAALLSALYFLTLPDAISGNVRCNPPTPDEPIVYSDGFLGSFTLEEMAQVFDEHYRSGRRLKSRAYFDSSQNSFVLPHRDGLVKVDSTFVASVTRHVEISLERRYADFIFFPDMGHSHLFIPESDYERLLSIKPASARYEAFFSYRKLKVLYHTAEKLTVRPGKYSEGPFPQDPVLLWRYFARNPVGDNDGGESVFVLFQLENPEKYNTVKRVPGHSEYSAGFEISASKDGCFPYQHKGKTQYFDLSLEPLPCQNCLGF